MISPDTSEWFTKTLNELKECLLKVNIGNSLFKIAIVIIGIIYLALYYNQSLNGRYSLVDKNEHIIIDHRTGILYLSDIKKHRTYMLDQVDSTFRVKTLVQLGLTDKEDKDILMKQQENEKFNPEDYEPVNPPKR